MMQDPAYRPGEIFISGVVLMSVCSEFIYCFSHIFNLPGKHDFIIYEDDE